MDGGLSFVAYTLTQGERGNDGDNNSVHVCNQKGSLKTWIKFITSYQPGIGHEWNNYKYPIQSHELTSFLKFKS